jgi:hypothetical protein
MISNHINRLCLFFGALALSQCTHAAITAVGAGNISDTINSASYRCNVDNGTWIWNAGITLPGVSSCNPTYPSAGVARSGQADHDSPLVGFGILFG